MSMKGECPKMRIQAAMARAALVEDENTLLFDAKNSSAIKYTDQQVSVDPPVEDGSAYIRVE